MSTISITNISINDQKQATSKSSSMSLAGGAFQQLLSDMSESAMEKNGVITASSFNVKAAGANVGDQAPVEPVDIIGQLIAMLQDIQDNQLTTKALNSKAPEAIEQQAAAAPTQEPGIIDNILDVAGGVLGTAAALYI